MKPDLILALCTNYSVLDIEPLISSIRRNVSNCAIVLFVAAMEKKFYDYAGKNGITLADPTKFFGKGYHDLNSRFFMYDEFLNKYGERYGNVMLTDVRDVIFQADPFAATREKDVSFAVEDGIISSSPYNYSWIKDVYGIELADEIGANPISCAGTTIGSISGMKRYIGDMVRELIDQTYDRSINYDQGIHNFIVWKQKPKYGAVDLPRRNLFTVGLTPEKRISIVDNKIFVDGVVAPVVHQWDRHKILSNFVRTSEIFKTNTTAFLS